MLPASARRPAGPILRIAGGLLITALTVLPVANIARIIATTGADVPSSDDYVFFVQFLGPALDGTFRWPDFFRATFYNTHAMYLPNLLYLANARLTDFNLYALLYLGLALAAVRIPLLWCALTRRADPPLPRALLWPLLAALACSEAQISIFEHGLTALGQNLTTTLLVVGAWCLARWPGRWRALWPTLAAGIAASLTFGSGLALWPAFLLGLPADARLSGLRLDPVYGAASDGTNTVQLTDFRLIRAPRPGGCAP